MQAVSALTTRRTLFGGALLLTGAATVAACASPALARPITSPDADFVRAVEGLHDGGGVAARHALAAGMDPKHLVMVLLFTDRSPGMTPALMFRAGDAHRTFRPRGED